MNSERGIFHDVGHVLAGHPTDARGEIQQAAFQAGFTRKDGFGTSSSASSISTWASRSRPWPMA
jgi:hypothetical protein